MTKEEQLKFQIDQLRKDKIIYATESVATTLISSLFSVVLIFLAVPFNTPVAMIMLIISILGAISYWVYMGVGNFSRLNKIKQLEKELYK